MRVFIGLELFVSIFSIETGILNVMNKLWKIFVSSIFDCGGM